MNDRALVDGVCINGNAMIDKRRKDHKGTGLYRIFNALDNVFSASLCDVYYLVLIMTVTGVEILRNVFSFCIRIVNIFTFKTRAFHHFVSSLARFLARERKSALYILAQAVNFCNSFRNCNNIFFIKYIEFRSAYMLKLN